MNQTRRQKIKQAIDFVQDILDEEQEAYDGMPESLQESPNGIISMEAQENLELAIESLEEAISYLEEASQ